MFNGLIDICQASGNIMPDLSDLLQENTGQVDFFLKICFLLDKVKFLFAKNNINCVYSVAAKVFGMFSVCTMCAFIHLVMIR